VRQVLPAALLSLVILVAASSGRADVWRRVDGDGVVHLTNVRPQGPQARRWRRVALSSAAEPGKRGRQDCDRCDQVPARDQSPDRFSRYDAYIREAAELYTIPVALLRAVIKVESDYDPRVVSSMGARGLMQLMPSAAEHMRVNSVHDPRTNILAGARLLRVLANRFKGDLVLTIAAYHSGAAKVARYGQIPPFPRVEKYVQMVLKRYYQYRQAERKTPENW
jgi:soluble lytic murein transglycosylase-like protein